MNSTGKERGKYDIYRIVPTLNALRDKMMKDRTAEFLSGMSFTIAMVSIAIRNSVHYNQHILNKKLQEDLEDISYRYVQLKKENERLEDKLKETDYKAVRLKHRRWIHNLVYSDKQPTDIVTELRKRVKNWKTED